MNTNKSSRADGTSLLSEAKLTVNTRITRRFIREPPHRKFFKVSGDCLWMADGNISSIASQTIPFDFSFIEFFQEAKPVLIFLAGIFVYALFIFKFYRFLATNQLLELKLSKYSKTFSGYIKFAFKIFAYVLENLVVIPILTFFWFAVFALMLLLISETTSAATILLTAMSLVGAVRVASYYKEELAQEIAKTVPFAMLAIFLMDVTFFSYEKAVSVTMEMLGMWKQLLYYLLVVVLIEFIMRVISGIGNFAKKGHQEEES